MNEIDITQKNLYIKKLINVIKSANPNIKKLLSRKNRHSDAFIYIISGSCTYYFDTGNEFTVNSGDILYLAHNSVYDMYVHTTDYKFIFCDFEFDCDLPRKCDFYAESSLPNTTESIFRKLFNSNSRSTTSFCESMSLLYEIYGIVTHSAKTDYISPSAKAKVNSAKEYIDANITDSSLSVKTIAEAYGMSEVYFRKLFKSSYHISPSKYIISMRLNKAKEFMKYPFLTVEECALQSGFSSCQYFCRIFKKKYGVTPHKYKN